MLEHQEPFDALGNEHLGNSLADQPGLRVTTSSAGFLLLQSKHEAALQGALAEETGLSLPGPHEACTRGNYALLWLTPAADVPAILWKTGEPNRFRCLFDRSFAARIRQWLTDATRAMIVP